jgi:HAD superfamily hydrolase (TIGR01459 family)
MQNLSRQFPVWFCDIWGVVHNGVTPSVNTVRTLINHRENGGNVVLVSNSPRTAAGVEKQLDEIGVDRASWDSIVTSGDVTRVLMVEKGGGALYHIGPSRDFSLFEGLNIDRVDPENAKAIVCTGLFDEHNETADDYRPQFAALIERRLAMICANPDKIVRKGTQLLPCAGALAEVYAKMGGEVYMAGKPFHPIYELALKVANTTASKVLAIGDGPETDIRGAADFGLPVVLVSGGINEASANLEREVQSLVPNARILKTLPELNWEA